jgi:glyoxylase-like metal-dependent hydrolase (beta-lactamase superfamily II)
MKINKIAGTYNSNTYVAGDGKDVVIIDSGAAAADVAKIVGSRKVLGIFITHEHFDHLTNCADYARQFNADIYCSREVFDNLVYYRTQIEIEGVLYDIAQLSDEVKVNIIRSEDELSLGSMIIKPYFMPGHSFGSIVYCIGDDMFTGDVLFTRGIGRTDLMTDGKKYMTKTLNRLADIKFATAHHGHGEDSAYDAQHKNIQVFAKWLSRKKT